MKAELIYLQLWQWHLLSPSFYHTAEYSSSVSSLNSWNLSVFVYTCLSLFSPVPQIRRTLQRFLGFASFACYTHTNALTSRGIFQGNFNASGQEKFLAQLYKYLLRKHKCSDITLHGSYLKKCCSSVFKQSQCQLTASSPCQPFLLKQSKRKT